MIDVKIQSRKLQDETETVRFTDLKVAILNSAYGPYLKKGDRYPYKLKEFLPKGILKEEKITEAEKDKRWLSAGQRMMAVVRAHERDLER